ncbi:unnamed protein product [Rangifer tarandus platyrhynchus]|uniref:Uncharacterized protein n=2 Tax=Rangifer tarandus platyrhynchus TaxID=3082113 RepID=A0ABN8Z1H5_RANTA|nr:unnamed protein product [Rangifer tarandus platyrhynchus]
MHLGCFTLFLLFIYNSVKNILDLSSEPQYLFCFLLDCVPFHSVSACIVSFDLPSGSLTLSVGLLSQLSTELLSLVILYVSLEFSFVCFCFQVSPHPRFVHLVFHSLSTFTVFLLKSLSNSSTIFISVGSLSVSCSFECILFPDIPCYF